MKVAIIGIQGIPAKYGGFESLVENITGREGCGVEYTVFCSSRDMPERLESYHGCRLKYVGLRANGMQSILYDIVSMMRSLRGYDTVLILGVSGCVFLPVFRLLSRSRVVVNIDGLEHRRDKWGRLARWFLRFSERCAVRFADTVVSDNKGIQDYVSTTYGRPSELIAYGGDHVLRTVPGTLTQEILKKYGLTPMRYSISVCRIEPENNCHVTLEAFARTGQELVFVGNWHRSAYGQALWEKYSGVANLHLLDAIYDLDILYVLRSNASWYVHGHSAGGTNPSLVEAMFFGRPIVAFDVVYNRETTFGQARYFADAAGLEAVLTGAEGASEAAPTTDAAPAPETASAIGETLRQLARQHYTWSHIARQYESLFD